MIESLSAEIGSKASTPDLQSKISTLNETGGSLNIQSNKSASDDGDRGSNNGFQERREKSDLRSEGKGLVLDISA